MPRAVGPSLLALALAACAVAPRVAHAPAPLQPGELAAAQTLAAPAADWPATAWWTSFGDPQLDSLIGQALQGSPTLKAAAARLRAAQAAVKQARAPLFPQLSANGRADMEKQSYNMGFPAEFVPHGWNSAGKGTLDLDLNIDLWGRNRAALAAATSAAKAEQVELEQARLVLSTSIAAAYADLAGLYLQRDVAARAVAIREATQSLATQRADTGLDNRGPEFLARSRLPAARADLQAIDEQIDLTRDQLAALTGAGPDAGRAIERPGSAQLRAFGLPDRLALDLVGRRPDIVAARWRATAAAARVHVARADFYPNIDLLGMIGLQSLELRQIADRGSSIGSIGPAIHLPIFSGGQLRGAYRQARANYDQAVADYDQVLVDALRQVADAAISLRSLEQRRKESADSLTAAEEAYRISRLRYEGGLASYLDLLNAEDTLLDRRRADASLQARGFALQIALVRALGGGYTERAATN